jgi:hypothetical protein
MVKKNQAKKAGLKNLEKTKESANERVKAIIKTQEFLVIMLLFIFLSLAIIIPNYWGSFPLNRNPFTSMYFDDYDKVVYDNEDFCFSFDLDIQSQPIFRNNIAILINNEVQEFEKVFFSDKNYVSRIVSYNYCYDSNLLVPGNNKVTAMLGTEKLFFNIERKEGQRKETNFLFDVKDINSEGIAFNFTIENFNRFEPIEIYLNGELEKKVYPVEGRNNFFEKINYSEGENVITLKFRDEKVSEKFTPTIQTKMNPFLGLVLFLVGIFVFSFMVFSEEDYFRKLALSFASLFVFLISIAFLLNALSILSLTSFISLYIISLIVLAIVFRNKLDFNKIDLSFLNELKNPLIFLVLFAAIALPLFFNVFTVSNYSYWNVYYERQANELSENFSLPIMDETSYFGRPMAFIPGYFFFDASISWLFGLNETALFGILLVLGNLFFLLALFAFSKSFNFSLTKAALFYIFMWMENFIRGALFVSPRHAISLALFLIAMMLLIEHRKKILSGIIIGFCGFVQAPLLVAFPILYLIITKKIKLKKMLPVLIIGAITFAILFIPNLLNFGMLSQAEKSTWGYLINYDLLNVFLDLGPLLVFFVLFILPDIIKKNFKWTTYKTKLFIFAILGILFQLFVSYRWNIFNTINISLFLLFALPESTINKKSFLRLFAILILLVGLVMSSGINLSQITNYQTTAFDFVLENGSSQDRVLNDPLFGHSLAFFTDKPIMADLAVEYAPEGQLFDTYNFLEDKNYLVIKEYSIEWVVNQSLVVNTQAFGSVIQPDFVEFDKLDKVFTNSFFYVHWVGNNLEE